MDAIQALRILNSFESKTKSLPLGVIRESVEVCNKTFWVHFRVDFYHVMIRMIIGTRGGVMEDNIVVDTRPKSSKVESLVCANFELRPTLFLGGSERSLVAFSVGTTRGMRKEDVARKVRSALDDFVRQVTTNPNMATDRIRQVASWTTGTSLGTSRYTMTRA
jgi:hypothetical protein